MTPLGHNGLRSYCLSHMECLPLDMSTARPHLKSPQSLSGTSPPHHGYPKIMVAVMNDQLTTLSFDVDKSSHSRNKAISNFDLETSRSRSWVWSKEQGHTVSAVSNWFAFFSFHINQITLPEIQLFWNLTLKTLRSRSWVRSKVKVK